MTKTLEKQTTKATQTDMPEISKFEKDLLRFGARSPQRLKQFYNNILCFIEDENIMALKQEKESLLNDPETIKFFLVLNKKFGLETKESRERLFSYISKNFANGEDVCIVNVLNDLFGEENIVGWFYVLWSYIEDISPIIFTLSLDKDEKKVVKYLLFEGDFEMARITLNIPVLHFGNTFENNFLFKTNSKSIREGLHKLLVFHYSKTEYLNQLEDIKDSLCANLYCKNTLNSFLSYEKDYAKFIVEGAISNEYKGKETMEKKMAYLNKIKDFVSNDFRVILTGEKRLTYEARIKRLYDSRGAIYYFKTKSNRGSKE